tara:strand:- start:10185 stop:10334 length:150 start_codon:yes stop_codon:yes gene_type:complete
LIEKYNSQDKGTAMGTRMEEKAAIVNHHAKLWFQKKDETMEQLVQFVPL